VNITIKSGETRSTSCRNRPNRRAIGDASPWAFAIFGKNGV